MTRLRYRVLSDGRLFRPQRRVLGVFWKSVPFEGLDDWSPVTVHPTCEKAMLAIKMDMKQRFTKKPAQQPWKPVMIGSFSSSGTWKMWMEAYED